MRKTYLEGCRASKVQRSGGPLLCLTLTWGSCWILGSSVGLRGIIKTIGARVWQLEALRQ